MDKQVNLPEDFRSLLNNLFNLPRLKITEKEKKEVKVSTVDLSKSPTRKRGSLF